MKLKFTLIFIFLISLVYQVNAQCSGVDFEEINGIAVYQMESNGVPSQWSKQTANAGFTGSSYIRYVGSNNFNTPNIGRITYKVKINSPGTYRFQWRSKVGLGNNSTEHNDSWLRIPDAFDFFAQKGNSIKYPRGGKFRKSNTIVNGSSSNGWMKAYLSGTTSWTWTTFTSDNDTHKIYAEFTSPGIYTIQVSGRSRDHLIDRMVLYKESSYSETSATNVNRSETLCSGSGDDNDGPPPPPPSDDPLTVPTIRLVNADTDKIIGTINNGSQIDLNIVNNANLTFRAFTAPTVAGSVQFKLTGPTSGTTNDNTAPFTPFGSSGTNYQGRQLPPGSYTLEVTPYQNDNLGGTQGTKRTVNFTVVGGSTQGFSASIAAFRLINADTDKMIGTLVNGSEIDLNIINNANLNINTITAPSNVGSVRIVMNGPTSNARGDNAAPYSLYSSNGSNFSGTKFLPGNYTLRATPYELPDLQGAEGTTTNIQFEVKGGVNVTENISFTLINAASDNDVITLQNGNTLSNTYSTNVNVRANLSNTAVQSVLFTLSGAKNHTRIENDLPYALYGAVGNNYTAGTLRPGNYTLKADGYSLNGANGTIIESSTITFSVALPSLNSTAAKGGISEDAIGSVASKTVAYPNPSPDGRFNVQLGKEIEGNVSYSVVNSAGIVVDRGESNGFIGTSDLNIDLSKSAISRMPGIYYLVIQTVDGKETIPLVRK